MLLSDIASLFDVELTGVDKEFNSVSTDTRSLQPGDLFIALTGEHFNGHDYLELAVEKGAVAAIVAENVNVEIPVFKTQDTRLALGRLGA